MSLRYCSEIAPRWYVAIRISYQLGGVWCQRQYIKGMVCGASLSGFPNNDTLAMRALGGFVGFATYTCACEVVWLPVRVFPC